MATKPKAPEELDTAALDRLAATPCCQPKPARCYYTVEPEDWTALLAMAREQLRLTGLEAQWNAACEVARAHLSDCTPIGRSFFIDGIPAIVHERDALRARVQELERERDAIRILALDAMNERDGYKDLAREDMVQVLATIQGALTQTINERDEARRRVGGPADEGTLRDCSDCGRPLVWKHSGGDYAGSMVCPRCVVNANDAISDRHSKLVEAAMDFAIEAEGCPQCCNSDRLSALDALLADEGTKG